MQIQNAHIRLLPKKIKELQSIRRVQEQSIALLTKELEDIKRRQRETHGMLMEEGATKLQRGRKRKLRQSNSKKVYEDTSKSCEVPKSTTDNNGSLYKERVESDKTGMSAANTNNNNVTLYSTTKKWSAIVRNSIPIRQPHRDRST
jgi:hypothetical protein